MTVKQAQHLVPRRAISPAVLVLLGLAFVATHLCAQEANRTSATNPFFGSVTLHPATEETLQLSLDEAVGMGLKNNLGLKEAESNEKVVQGEKNEALQEFLPTILLSGSTGFYMHNLVALGFGPSTLANLGSFFPGSSMPSNFPFITRDTLTQGQVLYSQTLFSGPVIAGWKAAGAAARAAHFAKMSARGEVVQQVASSYLLRHCRRQRSG